MDFPGGTSAFSCVLFCVCVCIYFGSWGVARVIFSPLGGVVEEQEKGPEGTEGYFIFCFCKSLGDEERSEERQEGA